MLQQQPLWPVMRTANNFFPTPLQVIDRMFEGLVVNEGDILLEPSAGSGNIAHVLRNRYPDNELRLVEIHPVLQDILRNQHFRVVGGDVFEYAQSADVIVANPPFREDFQDIDHFLWYWSLLAPGGRISCILHEYSAFPYMMYGKPYDFMKFLIAIGAERDQLPNNSFISGERPSPVKTALVRATKGY